jgi:hypothetical protein
MIKWGAEIPCNGRPDWLKDNDVCWIFRNGWWQFARNGLGNSSNFIFCTVTAIKLPTDHSCYHIMSEVNKLGGNIEICQAIATLEAAGYTVTKPDPYITLATLIFENTEPVSAILRRAIPDPASIDMTALAKVGDV